MGDFSWAFIVGLICQCALGYITVLYVMKIVSHAKIFKALEFDHITLWSKSMVRKVLLFFILRQMQIKIEDVLGKRIVD